jgi:hypothetical protein
MEMRAKIARRLRRGSQPGRARDRTAGRFEKGHEKSGGRKRGVKDILTREAKEAIIQGLSAVGEDGRGKDELVG